LFASVVVKIVVNLYRIEGRMILLLIGSNEGSETQPPAEDTTPFCQFPLSFVYNVNVG
jgi:hypothetical protein